MRVHELAKELGVASKELLTALRDGNFSVSSHMAILTDPMRQHLEKIYSKKKQTPAQSVPPTTAPKVHKEIERERQGKEVVVAKTVVAPEREKAFIPKPVIEVMEKEITPGAPVEEVYAQAASLEDLEMAEQREQERVRKLLQAKGFAGLALPQGAGVRRRRRRRRYKQAPVQVVPKGPVTAATIEKDSMLLFEVADLFGKQSGELIMSLLRKKMVCNRNHVLSLDVIKDLAQQYGIALEIKITQSAAEKAAAASIKNTETAHAVTRWPVVVVMGHVDHGKTTLLDYIRKMNVAASEKGGITQHISAWEVDSSHGKIVFLDTPGHEAFSYLRQRGSKVTDIAILVIAVDDGIKPQTIEAIQHAKSAGVPIVVAVNKIDKMSSPSALETIKRQLAQYELLPEEWGGQTIMVPISAKTGQGVEELLEMIVLQSQMMDLKADTTVPARAFVLESHIEKGLGPVATVICKEGLLKQGDYFVCGTSTGKVRILINSAGKRIPQAYPSTPVQIVGFDSFAGASDMLLVVAQDEYLKAKSGRSVEVLLPAQKAQAMQMPTAADKTSKFINLIIKTDTRGSKEAVMDSIDKVIKANKEIKCPVNIVFSAIGDIVESDVDLAVNTDSIIVGLHTHVEKNAQILAKNKNVDIKTYQIIYELIDDVNTLLLSKKEVVKAWNKVGEASVLKVFDIKGVGIIAGCYMREGVLARGNKVGCMRGGKQVGEGKVTSLQRDRKSVKEVHSGFECGFTSDGFDAWQEGDTVVIYAETKVE